MALNIATEFKKLIFLINHPVNSLYFSDSNTNPNTFYGGNCGTWTQINGYYIYAGNTSSNTSYTGTGTQSHTLTTQQIPKHKHGIRVDWNDYATPNVRGAGGSGLLLGVDQGANTSEAGGGQGHLHNIATHQCYVWKRTA